MSAVEKHIINTYEKLFMGLSPLTKMELIKRLTKSLRKEKRIKKDDFYLSFGAFASGQSAEEIISEIKSSRKFKSNDINLDK